MAHRNGLVIVVGSVNVDVVVRVERLPGPGETVAGGKLERHGGGKGANQAVAARRAGAQVRLIGAVGDDDFGAAALAELRDEGVDCDGVAVLAGEATGLAAITVDARGENQIAVASGANQALSGAAVSRALDALPGCEGAVLVLSFELGDEPLEAAATWARRRGVERVLANPAPARPLSGELVAARPLLTPNAGELGVLCGDGGDIEAAAAALGARTGAPVIVTLGARGALLSTAAGPRRFAAAEVQVRDTTGAGDAFTGALAAALAQGSGVEGAVARAVAAGSASVRSAGARGGLPTREEIDELTTF